MKLDLTEDQFRALVRQLAMADMVHGHLCDAYKDEEFERLHEDNCDLMQLLKSKAEDFGAADIIEELEGGKYFVEPIYGEAFENLLVFEEDIVIQRLAQHFAEKDWLKNTTEDQRKKMKDERRFKLKFEFIDKYEEMLDERGLDCLSIEED